MLLSESRNAMIKHAMKIFPSFLYSQKKGSNAAINRIKNEVQTVFVSELVRSDTSQFKVELRAKTV